MSTVSPETWAPATPITRLKFDSSPSFAPSTAARSALPLAARWRPSSRPSAEPSTPGPPESERSSRACERSSAAMPVPSSRNDRAI